MSGRRALCTFRVADVRRAFKAARAEGYEYVRVEITTPTGKIAIVASHDAVDVGDRQPWLKDDVVHDLAEDL
jgi:hypothetical protein